MSPSALWTFEVKNWISHIITPLKYGIVSAPVVYFAGWLLLAGVLLAEWQRTAKQVEADCVGLLVALDAL